MWSLLDLALTFAGVSGLFLAFSVVPAVGRRGLTYAALITTLGAASLAAASLGAPLAVKGALATLAALLLVAPMVLVRRWRVRFVWMETPPRVRSRLAVS